MVMQRWIEGGKAFICHGAAWECAVIAIREVKSLKVASSTELLYRHRQLCAIN